MPPRKFVDSRGASRVQRDRSLADIACRLMDKGVPAQTLMRLVSQGKTAEQIEAMYVSDGQPVSASTEETA